MFSKDSSLLKKEKTHTHTHTNLYQLKGLELITLINQEFNIYIFRCFFAEQNLIIAIKRSTVLFIMRT